MYCNGDNLPESTGDPPGMSYPESSSPAALDLTSHLAEAMAIETDQVCRRVRTESRLGCVHVASPAPSALHVIDLSSDNPELAETAIRQTFGLTDMYRDFTKPSDQHYLEKQLSKLESQAAMLISKICKAFDSGN
jgi:uncharacterized protein DUF4238